MKKEVINTVAMALLHIHTLAKVLESKSLDDPEPPSKDNDWSSEGLTFSQIIVEKAEFCLKAINEYETTAL